MFTPILGTLAYVVDGSRVLMIHKTRPGLHQGKSNGLGGKLEPGEDIVSGMIREVAEESGLEVTSWRLRGTISWPGFGSDGEDWFGFVFIVDGWRGEPVASGEGELSWVDIDRLAELSLWEGDRFFLPLVFDSGVAQFHGVMPYENGHPASWSVQTVPAETANAAWWN